jgi:hypothetical protein
MDIIFVIILILLLILFFLIWKWVSELETAKQPSGTIKGFILPSLGEPCVLNKVSQGVDLLNVPDSFTIGNCSAGYTCSTSLFTDADQNSGVCLSKLGGSCNSLLDCDQSVLDIVNGKNIRVNICLNGVCEFNGNFLNNLCYTDSDCMFQTPGETPERESLDLLCSSRGRCKYNYNKGKCYQDSDCYSDIYNNSFCAYDETEKTNVCKLYGVEGENNPLCGNGLYYNSDQKMCQNIGMKKGDLGSICSTFVSGGIDNSLCTTTLTDKKGNITKASCLYNDNIFKKLGSSISDPVVSLSSYVGTCSYPIAPLYGSCNFTDNNCVPPYYCETEGKISFCKSSLFTMYCGLQSSCSQGFNCVEDLCKTSLPHIPCVNDDPCANGCDVSPLKVFRVGTDGVPIPFSGISLPISSVNDETFAVSVYQNVTNICVSQLLPSIHTDGFYLGLYCYKYESGAVIGSAVTIDFSPGDTGETACNCTYSDIVGGNTSYFYSDTISRVLVKKGDFIIRKTYINLGQGIDGKCYVVLEGRNPFPYPITLKFNIDKIFGGNPTDNIFQEPLVDLCAAFECTFSPYQFTDAKISDISSGDFSILFNSSSKISDSSNYITKTCYSFVNTNNNFDCFLTGLFCIFNTDKTFNSLYYVIFRGGNFYDSSSINTGESSLNITSTIFSDFNTQITRNFYLGVPIKHYQITDITPSYTDYTFSMFSSPIINKKYYDRFYNTNFVYQTSTGVYANEDVNFFDNILSFNMSGKIVDPMVDQLLVYQRIYSDDIAGDNIYFFHLKGYENIEVENIYYDPSGANIFGNKNFFCNLNINTKKAFMSLYSENNTNTSLKNYTMKFNMQSKKDTSSLSLPEDPNLISGVSISGGNLYLITGSCKYS